MQQKLNFRTQPLLFYKDGHLRAAMSPMGFADEISERLHKPVNILVRIWFDDDTILQQDDCGERTGHDHLIIGYQDENEYWLTFWLDKADGLPIAMAFGSDRKTWVSPIYRKTLFIKPLSDEELDTLFQYLFDHPEELATGLR